MHNTPTDSPMTHDGDGREALSALFDGELETEAARFAHRRLVHDGQWREACGRWQLAGDVLRRRAEAVAPVGFADRIARAMADEAMLAGQAAVPAGPRPRAASRSARRHWVPGAALAASVAVAALFVARPLSNPDPAGSDAGPSPAQQVATAVTETSSPSGGATGPAPRTAAATITDPITGAATRDDAGTEAALAAVAAAVAVAEVPRRGNERLVRGQSRGQDQRAAMRVARREPSPAVATADGPSTEALAALPVFAPASAAVETVTDASGAATRDPFHPGEAATGATAKPWPRAVLPGYGGQGGYTVGYGEPVPVSPSFYPFEPRPPEGEDAPSADPQAPPPPGR